MKLRSAFIGILFSLLSTNASAQAAVIRYDAFAETGGILHSWVTGKGSTCSDLAIQSSTDNLNFSEIFRYGGICGSTEEELSYSWSQPNPEPGTWFFRIVENGTLYSDTISTTVVRQNSALQILPNPVSRVAQILLPQGWNGKEIIFSMYSLDGKRFEPRLTSGSELKIDVSNLTPSIYALTVQRGVDVFSTRLFVQHP